MWISISDGVDLSGNMFPPRSTDSYPSCPVHMCLSTPRVSIIRDTPTYYALCRYSEKCCTVTFCYVYPAMYLQSGDSYDFH